MTTSVMLPEAKEYSVSDLILKLRDIRFIRYVLASVGALAVDMGGFLALLSAGVWAPWASAIAYCAGIIAHWLMSSRAVFVGNVAEGGAQRTRQKALFVMSALVGLGLTTAIVWAGDIGGMDPRIAKLIAIGVSFVATWILRSKVVFR